MLCPYCDSERVRKNKRYYLRNGTLKQCLTCMNCERSHSITISKVAPKSYVGDNRYSKIISRLGDKCQLCGNRDHLEIHHKIPLVNQKRHSGSRYDSWKHVKDLELLCKSCHISKNKGLKLTTHKGLTRRDVMKIKKLYAKGIKQTEIAEKYGVAPSTIRYHLRKSIKTE